MESWLCLRGGALVSELLLWFFEGQFWLQCQGQEGESGLLWGGIQLGEEERWVFVWRP